jgi:hypothetical protein
LESDKIFVLFHSEEIFEVYPKRAFELAESQQFRELLRSNIISQSEPAHALNREAK